MKLIWFVTFGWLLCTGLPVANASAPFSEKDRAYWAFQPVTAPAVPQPRQSDWSRNDVDRFVLAKLEQANISPAPQASRRSLARRAYLDLLGLPPTPDQMAEFLDDPSPDAYERLVDRLLESPRYGERWARHWLDLVRYADSDGYKADVYRPHAWRYRDYVIQSFNQDKGYDRFLLEQLAGDELFPGDLDALAATGFLRLWPYEDNQIDVRRQWEAVLDDITEITAESLMGLGLRCARCHDHKYDPILQKDYYRLQAFFAPILPKLEPTRFPVPELEDYTPKLTEWEKRTAEVRAKMNQVRQPLEERRLKGVMKKFPDYLQVIYNKPADQLTPLERQFVHLGNLQILNKGGQIQFKGESAQRWKELNAELKQFDTLKPEPPPAIMGVIDVGPLAPPTLLKDEVIEPGYPSILSPEPATIDPPDANPNSTGRRSALARWLTRPDNPLAQRVIVNRIWQHHFGDGIVATPNDFGRQGTPPTHPELLDWLAHRFVQHNWSFKKMHKLLMTSATYQQASQIQPSPQALTSDPQNRLLWRMRVHRLDGEQIRDSMLRVSGELQHRSGGPGAKSEEPCRSVYLKNIRNRHHPVLMAFDGPDMFNSCARRNTTTTPLQSLLLLNSEWSFARAQGFASQVRKAVPNGLNQQIHHAYQLALARPPDAEEIQVATDFFQAQPNAADAWVDFCHVLLNSNEFVYVD